MSGVIDPGSGETVPVDATSPFPNPGETATNFDAQSSSRVVLQYRKSPRLLQTISDNNSAFQGLENCAVTIPPLDDPTITDNPSSQTNKNLDVTGDLVGQSRILANGTVVTNTVYLALIALRILRNTSIGSSPQYLAFLTYVLQTFVGGSSPFRYYDVGGMAVGLEVGVVGGPSSDQRALLDYGPAPRSMAVGVGRLWYDPANYFGFAEDSSAFAFGFAEIGGSPTIGGKFSEVF